MISWSNFNWIDYGILILITLSILISLARGFTKEVLSLVSWILAIWVGIHFTPIVSNSFLAHWIHNHSLRWVIVFLVLFLSTLLLGAVVNFLISSSLSRMGLTLLDRLIGLVFGLARGVLMISVIIFLTSLTSFEQQPAWQKSQLIPSFDPVLAWFKRTFPEQVKKITSKAKAVNADSDKKAPLPHSTDVRAHEKS